MPKQPKDLAGKDLRNVNVSTDNLHAADLSSSNLSGALLRDVDLTEANLEDADLRGAHLEGADLSGANLRNADFSDADVRGAKIERAAELEGVRLANATGVPDEVRADHIEPPPVTQDTSRTPGGAKVAPKPTGL